MSEFKHSVKRTIEDYMGFSYHLAEHDETETL